MEKFPEVHFHYQPEARDKGGSEANLVLICSDISGCRGARLLLLWRWPDVQLLVHECFRIHVNNPEDKGMPAE
jgi:hypothetical protein